MPTESMNANKVIDGLMAQLRSLAHAASVASDPKNATADVYNAIEACMERDTGVTDMTAIYDSIVAMSVAGRAAAQAIENASESGAFVYFIKRPDGLVKIGYSHDVVTRLSQLKTQYGPGLELLAATPGARGRERDLHMSFADDRVSGEWFKPSDKLKQLIASLHV